MKTALSALVLAFAATGALAESPAAAGPTAAQPTSALTRAEVMQQVLDARSAGTLLKSGELGQVPAPMASAKTREQVRSEWLRTDPRSAHAAGYQPA
jgi:hypothetical protein